MSLCENCGKAEMVFVYIQGGTGPALNRDGSTTFQLYTFSTTGYFCPKCESFISEKDWMRGVR